VKSPHDNAMPLIITHGWPGSVIELPEVAGPVTDPAAHGRRAEGAFDLVLPSLLQAANVARLPPRQHRTRPHTLL
jgi:hypothetical protein